MIKTAINKKVREMNERSHTDDLVDEFLEAGVPPELATEFALRFVKQKRFDEE